MSRASRLALVSLGLAFVLLPLALKKPGLPMQLRAGEATPFLMAASLAADLDLGCAPEDLRRLFAAFPFAAAPELRLASPDGGATLVFAEPLLYPLLAAPWVALFGADGLIACNLLLLWLSVAMATALIARGGTGENGGAPALLFAAGFFGLSAAFAQAFSMEPHLLTVAAVTAALYWAWSGGEGAPSPRRAFGSGLALAAGAYHQPLLALLAPALLSEALARRQARALLAWLGGALLLLALAGGLGFATTGELHPALAPSARTVAVADPLGQPPLPELFRAAPEPTKPIATGPLTAEAGAFLWGRHGGLLPYFPWVLPALLYFFLDGRRSRRRRWLALALGAALAGLWLGAPLAAQAAGDTIGNPLFLGLYPAFLGLVGALRPAWPTLAGYGLGALFLGGLLFTPFGAPIPESSWQAHTRHPALAALPLELAVLPELPDYRADELGEGLRLWSRRDQVSERGRQLVTLGGERVEAWLESPRELGSALVFEVESPARPNRVTVALSGEREELVFEAGSSGAHRLRLEPGAPAARRSRGGENLAFYRLEVTSERGERAGWSEGERGKGPYVGAGLLFLGPAEVLERELYRPRWLDCGAPRAVAPGERFAAWVRVANDSGHPWPAEGGARVRLAHRWLDPAGGVVRQGGRSELASDVEPGGTAESWLEVEAPRAAGRYRLEFDLIYERVAWFSSRGAETCRAEVEVAAGAGGR